MYLDNVYCQVSGYNKQDGIKRLATETGEARTLLFNLSGHGHFDMAAYDRYFAGELEDYEYPDEDIKAALGRLPKVG